MSAPRLSSGLFAPRGLPLWLCLLLPLVVGLLAITGGPFWIDECVTAEFVSQPTLAQWWGDLQATDYAEAQLPFYLAYLWLWAGAFGVSEWSLRLAALPWFVLGFGTFFAVLGGLRRDVAWAVLWATASSAFVWFYLNEAKLYAMQLSVTCLVVAALLMLARRETEGVRRSEGWFLVWLGGTLLLSGISIIGMIWAGAAVLILAGLTGPVSLWRLVRRQPVAVTCWVGVCCLLAAYYLASVLRGARASSAATTTVQTVIYIGYDLLGFAGLGPGRNTLRDDGAAALLAHLPLIASYGALLTVVLVAAVVFVWKSPWRARAVMIAGALALPCLLLLATGVLRHFRVLARHFTPLMAVVLLLLGAGLAALWQRGLWGRFVVTGFLCLSLVSAASIRWAPRHAKDDYRAAASLARQALDSGGRVWWNAAPQGAWYYGLPLTEDAAEPGKAFALFGNTIEDLLDAPPADLVLVTRPDIYDQRKGIASFLAQRGYVHSTNIPAFTIWERAR